MPKAVEPTVRWRTRPVLAPMLVLILVSTSVLALGPGPAAAQDGELGAAPAAGAPQVSPEAAARAEALWREEVVTDSFDRHLIDLAEALAAAGGEAPVDPERFFAAKVERTLPVGEPSGEAEIHPAIVRYEWPAGQNATVSRVKMAGELRDFLARFGEVEDAMLAVTDASLPADGEIVAQADLAVVGRNRDGERAWLRGEATVRGERTDDEAPWQISGIAMSDVETMVARRDLFQEVAEPAGIAATEPPLSETLPEKHWYPHGSAAHDVDGDGLLDLFVTAFSRNHLYLNRGDGTFQDRAASAGLAIMDVQEPEFSPVFLDYDDDGDSDLFVTAWHGNLLYENRLVPDGRLHFRNATAGVPQRPDHQGWTPVPGDVNGDGRTRWIPGAWSW